ncbi:MAG: glycosyltransferase family 2 protein [Anaerolineales bacterium]
MQMQVHTPDVSVVLAVYNGMPYIIQAVESILGQTWDDLELVLVNDASTDDTLARLHYIHDPRLRVIDLPENVGQTAALNVGLRAAQGQFIARQDADDISKPGRLAAQRAFLTAHPDYLLVGTAADLIDDKGRITGLVEHPTDDDGMRAAFAEGDNTMFHGSVMFRRAVLNQVGYYREGFRTSQDFDYWLRIAEQGKIGNIASPPLYQYRLHAGQMTFTSYLRMKTEWQSILKLAAIRADDPSSDDSAAYDDAIRELDEQFADFTPSRAEKRRAMAELWRAKGVAYKNAGQVFPMAYSLLRAFLWEPANPDFWRGVRNQWPR